jgi:hypothetical protein
MAMVNNFGGYNRGGLNGMRGGRGGMGGGMMTMGSMPMGPMGMTPMMGTMGKGATSWLISHLTDIQAGFQGANFNPGMFNQGAGPHNMGWNQHGNKRQRQE